MSNKKKPGWLNRKDMAASCGISPQAFTAWGVEPVGQIGREKFFDCQSVIKNRNEYEAKNRANRTSVVSPESDDLLDLFTDPAEKLKAQKTIQEIKSLELKNSVLEGRSLPAVAVTEVVTRILSVAVDLFETIPLEISRQFPDLDNRAISLIEKNITKVRNEAAAAPAHLDEILNEVIEQAEERVS